MRLKNFVQSRVFEKNYTVAKAGYLTWFFLRSLGKPMILIYQMGKVASTTVDETLKANFVRASIFHFHYLSNPAIAADENTYYEKRSGKIHSLKSVFPKHLFESYYIRRRLDAFQRGRTGRWKIISLVRDPVARNLSGFFEGILFRVPDFYERINIIPDEELYQEFIQRYDHRLPLDWFDRELQPYFGFDVFGSDFPRQKGYKIYSGANADLLLLRVEDLSRCLSLALTDFLGIQHASIVLKNEAKDKLYYDRYREFVNKIRLPQRYLDEMYQSKLSRHFYSEEEIHEFRLHWGRLSLS